MRKIETDISKYSYDKCCDSSDFYKIVDLFEYFKSREITDVSQMKCNQFTFDYVLNLLKSNSKNNKQIKYLKKEKREQSISFDWYNYAPTIDNNLDNYIILCELKEAIL